MTVREMLVRISSHEISEWQAFLTLENEDRKKDELAHKAEARLKS